MFNWNPQLQGQPRLRMQPPQVQMMGFAPQAQMGFNQMQFQPAQWGQPQFAQGMVVGQPHWQQQHVQAFPHHQQMFHPQSMMGAMNPTPPSHPPPDEKPPLPSEPPPPLPSTPHDVKPPLPKEQPKPPLPGQERPSQDGPKPPSDPPPPSPQISTALLAELEKVKKEEEVFLEQYKQWKKQYDDWREQNQNHPNKDQFEQYLTQWKTYEGQMETRKKSIADQKAKLEERLRNLQPSSQTASYNRTSPESKMGDGPQNRPNVGRDTGMGHEAQPTAGQGDNHPVEGDDLGEEDMNLDDDDESGAGGIIESSSNPIPNASSGPVNASSGPQGPSQGEDWGDERKAWYPQGDSRGGGHGGGAGPRFPGGQQGWEPPQRGVGPRGFPGGFQAGRGAEWGPGRGGMRGQGPRFGWRGGAVGPRFDGPGQAGRMGGFQEQGNTGWDGAGYPEEGAEEEEDRGYADQETEDYGTPGEFDRWGRGRGFPPFRGRGGLGPNERGRGGEFQGRGRGGEFQGRGRGAESHRDQDFNSSVGFDNGRGGMFGGRGFSRGRGEENYRGRGGENYRGRGGMFGEVANESVYYDSYDEPAVAAAGRGRGGWPGRGRGQPQGYGEQEGYPQYNYEDNTQESTNEEGGQEAGDDFDEVERQAQLQYTEEGGEEGGENFEQRGPGRGGYGMTRGRGRGSYGSSYGGEDFTQGADSESQDQYGNGRSGYGRGRGMFQDQDGMNWGSGGRGGMNMRGGRGRGEDFTRGGRGRGRGRGGYGGAYQDWEQSAEAGYEDSYGYGDADQGQEVNFPPGNQRGRGVASRPGFGRGAYSEAETPAGEWDQYPAGPGRGRGVARGRGRGFDGEWNQRDYGGEPEAAGEDPQYPDTSVDQQQTGMDEPLAKRGRFDLDDRLPPRDLLPSRDPYDPYGDRFYDPYGRRPDPYLRDPYFDPYPPLPHERGYDLYGRFDRSVPERKSFMPAESIDYGHGGLDQEKKKAAIQPKEVIDYGHGQSNDTKEEEPPQDRVGLDASVSRLYGRGYEEQTRGTTQERSWENVDPQRRERGFDRGFDLDRNDQYRMSDREAPSNSRLPHSSDIAVQNSKNPRSRTRFSSPTTADLYGQAGSVSGDTDDRRETSVANVDDAYGRGRGNSPYGRGDSYNRDGRNQGELYGRDSRNQGEPYGRDRLDPYARSKDDERDKNDFYARERSDPYNRARDDPYNRSRDDPKSREIEDPFNRSKDELSSRGKDDPYNRSKDDPYGRSNDDPYSRGKDDPYSRSEDEPYSRASDNRYGRSQDDPYSRTKDDPYHRLREDPYGRGKDDPYGQRRDDRYGRSRDRDDSPRQRREEMGDQYSGSSRRNDDAWRDDSRREDVSPFRGRHDIDSRSEVSGRGHNSPKDIDIRPGRWDHRDVPGPASLYGERNVMSPAKNSPVVRGPVHTSALPVAEMKKVEDLLCPPGRASRPPQLVIIIRGLPGSGKTYVSKLLREKEINFGGSAPRMLCLDDYFMVEVDKQEVDPDTGKKVKKKVLEYEYEQELEEAYRQSLLKSFKKTVDDGFFPFIILDATNEKVVHFSEFWSYAKSRGFQVYVGELTVDMSVCIQRNIHNWTEWDIQKVKNNWEPLPNHYIRLDLRWLLQDDSIPEVEMEDTEPNADAKEEKDEEELQEDEEESSFGGIYKSKWELDTSEKSLDKLDGIPVSKKHIAEHQSMQDYLQLDEPDQLDDDYFSRESLPGKKRVRWADLEEKKTQDRRRDLGFIVGQTKQDWERITDDDFASKALNRTKYFYKN